jgi:TRAP transporter 4TM/12TM fusion protein
VSSSVATQAATPQPHELIQTYDLGARQPAGVQGRVLFWIAFAWAAYQLWSASPLPFVTSILLMDDTRTRAIHVAFCFLLAFAAWPAFAASPRDRVPWIDWVLAILGAASALMIVAFYAGISARAGGVRLGWEMAGALVGLALLFEVTRRAIGLPLVIVAACFIAYAFLGPWMPDVIAHRGVTLNRFIDHMWLTTEGIFGIAIGVSDTIIFLYVLFGALLDRAGGGNYMIQLCISFLGHLRGGPAKACVVSSAATGLVSGSSIANIVSSGVFTIPLMQRVGYSREKAAAIETSSSINGQFMPPVMGAAAFLMTEFVGITYFEVIKHAFLPAVISYVGLYYIVHIEALKANIPVLGRAIERPWFERLRRASAAVLGLILVSGAFYFVFDRIDVWFGRAALWIVAVVLLVAYVAALAISARYPEITAEPPSEPMATLPATWPTLLAGLHHLLPIAVLIWCLMVEQLSAQTAVMWAIVVQVMTVVTQRPLRALFRGEGALGSALAFGVRDLVEAMVVCSRNMVGVAVAMASAGIIIGVVSLTGLGLQVTSIIETVSGGSFAAMLVLTAIVCIILGMGLPTTANYLVVVMIMAPVLVEVAARNGLVVPLIAVHLFVFYFGLISGTTPPVAVDAYAGAAIAKADPIKTCLLSFYYSMRTTILPFVFLFNTELLLIGIGSWWHLLLVLVAATAAIMLFAAASLGWWLVRSRWWETLVLLLISLVLMHPGLVWDRLYPPFASAPASRILELAERAPADALIRLVVSGENLSGDLVTKTVALPLGPAGLAAADRLSRHAGLDLEIRGERVRARAVRNDGPAKKAGIAAAWQIRELQIQTDRPAKHWLYLPAAALLAAVWWAQRRRRGTPIAA